MSATLNIRNLLGLRPSSAELIAYIEALTALAASSVPEIKSYPDCVYFNYFVLGLSLLFAPQNGYKPKPGHKREDLNDAELKLDSVDVYNIPEATSGRTAQLAFSTHPVSPLVIFISSPKGEGRPSQLEVLPHTTGKDFVAALGEPDRKGGGAGPSSGSIGIWCEWSRDGIMVEFGGNESRGPQAWERGKDAVWAVMTLFTPKST